MSATVVLRPAGPADAGAVRRLAALDSSVAPRGEVVLGLRGEQPVAAMSLTDGHLVADPFERTAEVAELLREHAAGTRDGRGRRAELLRRLRVRRPATA
jgi:hypothetical protein